MKLKMRLWKLGVVVSLLVLSLVCVPTLVSLTHMAMMVVGGWVYQK